MRKAFFLLFLLSSVISFAQKSLYSDLNPNGSWYTNESRDAAYESSVSKLHKTWIANNTPTESITFKPNNVGNIGVSLEQHDEEEDFDFIVAVTVPFTYTKNKDKITMKSNPLRITVSIKLAVETELSQRIKDVIAYREAELTARFRREIKQETGIYTIYRIDDYLVIQESTAYLPMYFVSKEYQAQAEARKAEQTKAENKEE